MLRIIAGTARGRTIEAPRGQGTRPTLDRVKEALFGSIQFDVPGSTVLDLFSGSGNLGLEAASRGAARVILNDHDRACAALIRRNAEATKLLPVVAVWQYDYKEAILHAGREGLRFDMVFIDAPYFEGLSEDAARRLFEAGLVLEDGFVLIEHARELIPSAGDEIARIAWTRNYGECGLTMLKGVPKS